MLLPQIFMCYPEMEPFLFDDFYKRAGFSQAREGTSAPGKGYQILGKVISFSKQTPVKICRFPIKIASGFISCFNFFFFNTFQVLLHLSGRLAFLQVRLFPDLSILTCLFFLYFLYYPNASLGPCGSY